MRMVCVDASPAATHAVDVTAFIEQGIASLQAHRVYCKISDMISPTPFFVNMPLK